MLYNKAVNNILKTYNANKHFIKNTALERNGRLSQLYNCNVFLKREDLHDVRSFKIRGAYNKIRLLTSEEKIRGVVCASAGNHAQGVAHSCANLGIQSDIFVPENTPLQKINSIRKFGDKNCTLHITGATFDESYHLSKTFSEKHSSIYIHPFSDKEVIYGQGTVGVEIYNQFKPDIIIGAIGGGGLMSGVSLYSKGVHVDCILYGVESEGCPSMNNSIKNGSVVTLQEYDTFVDGVAVKQVASSTYDICKNTLEDILLVSNGQLCNTMLDLYQNDGIIVEPAGALSIASLDLLDSDKLRDKNVVAIVSGGNNDITRYPEINELALRYRNLKHYFIINFAQRPGQLRKFVSDILGPDDDITRFEYIKKTNRSYGQVLVGIELTNPSNIDMVKSKFESHNFNYIYVNDNEQLMSYLI